MTQIIHGIPKLEVLRKEKQFGQEDETSTSNGKGEESKEKGMHKGDVAIYDENDFEVDEDDGEGMYNTDSAFEDSVS